MTDIWSIGAICYEMHIGKPIFYSENIDESVKNIEEGTYTIPITMSHEAVSFLNGMLQYDSKRRLTAVQLSKHDFLNKDSKDFHSINLQKVSMLVNEKQLKINVKNNDFIWSIFNVETEKFLISIEGKQLIKPIDKTEKIEFENLEKEELNKEKMEEK